MNPGVDPTAPGNPHIVDLDRWQPVALPMFVDQAGNLLEDGIPLFPGGIHPPADDIPGRQIGEVVEQVAFTRARQYFSGTIWLVAVRARLTRRPLRRRQMYSRCID